VAVAVRVEVIMVGRVVVVIVVVVVVVVEVVVLVVVVVVVLGVVVVVVVMVVVIVVVKLLVMTCNARGSPSASMTGIPGNAHCTSFTHHTPETTIPQTTTT
jgi:hypothetical protein